MSRLPGMRRLLTLLDPPAVNPDLTRGYLDLLDGSAPDADTRAGNGADPVSRPAGFLDRLLPSARRTDLAPAQRILVDRLTLADGATVLDVGCGAGMLTAELADAVGVGGLAIGLDVSGAALEVAARARHRLNLAYLRADAARLPLPSASVGGVCCCAVLELLPHPFDVVDGMARVLAPGGRIALLTTCGNTATAGSDAVAAGRVFGTDEITNALLRRGFRPVRQRVWRGTQIVVGEKPKTAVPA